MEKSIHQLSHSSEHQHQQYLEREQEAHVAVQTLEQSRVELEGGLSHMRLQLASVKKEKDQTISGTHTQDHAHIHTQHYLI